MRRNVGEKQKDYLARKAYYKESGLHDVFGTYYQPIMTEEEWDDHVERFDGYSDHEVFHSKAEAQERFPNHEIGEYARGDIGNPKFEDMVPLVVWVDAQIWYNDWSTDGKAVKATFEFVPKETSPVYSGESCPYPQANAHAADASWAMVRKKIVTRTEEEK